MMISGGRSGGHLPLQLRTTNTHVGNHGSLNDQQVPPSPTLTNPDMILPFGHDERESSTPSPPFNLPTLEQLQSFHRHQASGDSLVDGSQIGVAISSQDRPDTRTFPRPRWPFEGHETSSRRLSAIGEEDSLSPERVKQRVSGFGQQQYVTQQDKQRGLTGSPAFRRPADETSHRLGDSETARSASSSNSTVSANGSGSGSGRASSHSGTRQSEDRDREALGENSTGEQLRNSIMSVSEKDGPKEDPSSAILSTEAERILENAKKRLSLMEGNLNRARSSMRVSPSLSSSPSPSSASPAAGFNQPVGGLYRSISRSDRKPSLLRPRPPSNSAQDSNGNSNRHSRVHSEISLSLAAQSNHPSQDPNHLPRSVSAMASTSMSNHYSSEQRSFPYDSTRAYLTHRASTSSIRSPTLDAPRSPSFHEETSSGLGISNGPDPGRVSNIEDFNAAHPSSKPPSRAQSQMQVRDLKDQMKGLHIKISTLKVKSQEDSLRRRSLQSLRASSPFTAAEQWYTSAMEHRDARGSLSADAGHGWSATKHVRSSPRSSDQDQDQHSSNLSKQSTPRGSPPPLSSMPMSPPTDTFTEFDDSDSVVESLYEDAESGHPEEMEGDFSDDEEFNDSSNALPSVPHTFDDTPHEEREDAFDYEHFILHSALGNFSQAKLVRRSSVGSTSSVETTRPMYSGHSRANSTTSLSTEATFATATEGEYPSDDEGEVDDEVQSVLYWDKKFNRELRSRQKYLSPVPNHYEGQRSAMPTTAAATDEDLPDTPRAVQGFTQHSSNSDSNDFITHSRNASHTLQLPGPSSPSSPATPRALASSLVSTVRAASASASTSHTTTNPSDTPNGTTTTTTMGINHDDTRLLEELFQSLGNVCMELQTITTTPGHDPKEARLLRRRLDAARRVLEGELDA